MVRRVASSDGLRVRFWGIRGSTCASGPQFVEFGSHTPCIEVRCGERLFILDAGTGLSALGTDLGATAPEKINFLLTLLLPPHIRALPFSNPPFLPKEGVTPPYGELRKGDSPLDLLTRLFAPPLFPVRLG